MLKQLPTDEVPRFESQLAMDRKPELGFEHVRVDVLAMANSINNAEPNTATQEPKCAHCNSKSLREAGAARLQ